MNDSSIKFDPYTALSFKDKGNKCFQAGDYVGAEALYTKGLKCDPKNHLLYTNRAMCLLSLSKNAAASQPPSLNLPPTPTQVNNYERVIQDCISSICLSEENMKAHYFLAQAQIALHRTAGALGSVTEAHRLCVKEVHNGGKGGSSIGPITELFLRCKKEAWEDREKQRLDRQPGLVRELQVLIQKEHEQRVDEMNQKVSSGLLHGGGLEEEQRKLDGEFKRKTDDIQKLAAVAGIAGEETKKRVVPDWAIDDITFSVMVDPVVTKTGQSYDRSSIMEHLKRSKTDPLTREPLRVEDLVPNIALKEACAAFLEENGWAVDW